MDKIKLHLNTIRICICWPINPDLTESDVTELVIAAILDFGSHFEFVVVILELGSHLEYLSAAMNADGLRVGHLGF